MQFCEKCGKEVNEGDKFCQSCGVRLEKAEARGNKRGLLWVSLVIGFVVAIYELTWVDKSSLAWVIFAVAVAVVLQAVYHLMRR
jgi:uncharacterized membrane protein YvbJ